VAVIDTSVKARPTVGVSAVCGDRSPQGSAAEDAFKIILLSWANCLLLEQFHAPPVTSFHLCKNTFLLQYPSNQLSSSYFSRVQLIEELGQAGLERDFAATWQHGAGTDLRHHCPRSRWKLFFFA
jgi:hypothetical protein